MKSEVNRRKFKNFFISKDLQRPMIIAHSAYLLFVFAAIIATVLSPYYSDVLTASDLLDRYLFAKTFLLLLGRLSITSIFIVAISFFHFVIFSHKFCGPLVNIGHTIAKISKGDFTRKIYLRKGDFLKNEATQINAMMNSLSHSLAEIKAENHLLVEDMEKYIQSKGKQTDIDLKLKDFRNRASRCRIMLDNFKFDGETDSDVDSCQSAQVVRDIPLSADKCLP